MWTKRNERQYIMYMDIWPEEGRDFPWHTKHWLSLRHWQLKRRKKTWKLTPSFLNILVSGLQGNWLTCSLSLFGSGSCFIKLPMSKYMTKRLKQKYHYMCICCIFIFFIFLFEGALINIFISICRTMCDGKDIYSLLFWFNKNVLILKHWFIVFITCSAATIANMLASFEVLKCQFCIILLPPSGQKAVNAAKTELWGDWILDKFIRS